MIDQGTIQRILDTAEIVDVVGDFVTLKRRGTNFIGLCPFHNEKTPSFNVSPSKGIYKCFGCGKGGSVVNFVMEHEHLAYVEALKWLAKKYNIEVNEREETPEDIQARNDRESQMIVTSFAQKYFTGQLWDSNEGRIAALGYFRERGMRDDMVRKFELGYCPSGNDVFTQEALKAGYEMKYLEKTGLTIKRDDWIRDRFGGRVMFPIHGVSGRVIAFGGRTLSQDKKIAKYLNSPESEIYHKSRVLYGIYQAKRSIIQNDKCYLVEGYTDVISMHQSGIENVVASSGTSLTTDQIRLIRRFTNNITIIYDGDQAGIKASLRGIDLVLEEGVNVKVLPLPEGEDPDSFSRSMGASQLQQYIIDNETDFIKFKTRLLLEGTENDPITRARLTTDIVRSVSVIPDGIVRAEYLKECSRLMNVREEVLYDELRKLKRKRDDEMFRREQRVLTNRENIPEIPAPVVEEKPGPVNNPCAIEEREVLRMMLKYGDQKLFEVENDEGETEIITVADYLISELEADGIQSVDPVIRMVFHECDERFGQEGFDALRHFVQHQDSSVSQLCSNILSEKYTESQFWKKQGSYVEEEHEILHILVPRVLQEYKLRMVRFLINQAIDEMKVTATGDSFERIVELQRNIQNLKSVEKELSDKLGKRTINY